MMRGFCPEGAYVLMELCMEGVLSKGVLSEGVLSGGGFILPSWAHIMLRRKVLRPSYISTKKQSAH